jgi:hypothetical protein
MHMHLSLQRVLHAWAHDYYSLVHYSISAVSELGRSPLANEFAPSHRESSSKHDICLFMRRCLSAVAADPCRVACWRLTRCIYAQLSRQGGRLQLQVFLLGESGQDPDPAALYSWEPFLLLHPTSSHNRVKNTTHIVLRSHQTDSSNSCATREPKRLPDSHRLDQD